MLFGRARRVHVALDRVRGGGAARQRAQPARAAARSRRSGAARSARPTASVLARSVRRPGDIVHAPLPDRRPVRPRGRLLVHDDRARRARALAQRRADRPADRARHRARVDPRARRGGRRRPHDARRERAAGRGGGAARPPATRARSSRWTSSTGGVLAMASDPELRPERARRPGDASRGSTATEANAPLVNRATQNGYPPGSTMKVVTAAAALDSGALPAGLARQRRERQGDLGRPAQQLRRRVRSATIDLTFALTNSVNTVWAEVGEELGGRTMQRYMERFGFYAEPPMDYPDAADVGVRRAQGRRARPDDVGPRRRRARRDRPGRPVRDAACRWRRWRRRSATAASG